MITSDVTDEIPYSIRIMRFKAKIQLAAAKNLFLASCPILLNESVEKQQVSNFYLGYNECGKRLRENDNDEKTQRCAHNCHNRLDPLHPKENVPLRMFKVLKSGNYTKNCIVCLEFETKREFKGRQDKMKEKVADDEFYCHTCWKRKNVSIRSKKANGTYSEQCIECAERERERKRGFNKHLRQLQVARILETGYSCVVLREIHLQPLQETPYLIRRYPVIDGCVCDNGEIIDHKIFARLHTTELELRHLQNDHIPIDEWIGDIPWEPKKMAVCELTNLHDQKREFAKCQLVSGLGHVKITTKRYRKNGESKERLSIDQKQRREWINNYKLSCNCTCATCGISYMGEPLGVLHFDHIDIHTKIANISEMIRGNYTLEMIILEIQKCRLVCIHCHEIITKEQRKSGILQKKTIANIYIK